MQGISKRVKKAFVQQKDQADCGVACLLSVIRFYGGAAKLERLRELSGTSRNGTTLLGLFQAAQEVGLIAEAYEADIANLRKLTEPCILHVIKEEKFQHYVIYYGYYNGTYLISDPATGVREIEEKDLVEQWQSKALLLLKSSPALVQKRERNTERWKWLLNLIKRDVNILGTALVLGIFITVLGLSTAIFSQKLIDVILPQRDLTRLLIGVGLLSVLLFAQNGLSYMRQLFLIRQSRDFNNRIINNFYQSLLKLPIPFFLNRKTGDLIARMNDTSRLQQTITYLFANVMIDVLLIVVAAVYILYYSTLLGLFVLLSVPCFFFLTWYYNQPILEGQKKVMAAHSANESNYVDTIQGISTIKISNKESFFADITKAVYGFFQTQIFDLGKVGIHFGFWASIVSIVFIVSTLLFSSMLVLSESIMLGALVAIFQMASQLIPAANRLAMTNIQIQEARVAFDRMHEFTSLEGEQNVSIAKEKINSIDVLEVRNLSFRFPGRSRILEQISFSVKKGEMVALLGESGCGKTTILHILQKFLKPESGNININNLYDIGEINSHEWREQIAVVPQQVKIFNGTLIDNICLGDSLNEAPQVIQFCKNYGFDEYFESFPQSYITLLGEEGVNISGGQRQLVALARALYQGPNLLLLDEATSAMDRKTEEKMLRMLMSLKNKMAIILVTHRVQSVKLADCIYIIEDGQVVEKGEPKELAQEENLFSASLADLTI